MVFKKKRPDTISPKIKMDELSKLAGLAQSGDKKAYNKLLTLSIPYIQKVLYGSLSDVDSIEDITQEVLISIHKALNTYSPERKFTPWLYSIIQFRRIDYLRKYYSKRQNVTTDLENQEFINNHVTNTNHIGEYKDIEAALNALPKKQRNVFQLMKIQGHTAQEVADQTGMTVSAVKVSVHRALNKLKADLR